MHLRRPSAALAVAVLVATPMLSACGFNYGTDQRNTPGVGILAQTSRVDVLSAVIVSARPGEGTFIATLANRSQTSPIQFTSVEGGEGNTVTPADIDPISILPGDAVNLATDGRGVKLQGSFVPGDIVPITVGFGEDQVDTRATVVRACEEYAGLDPATTPSASPVLSALATPSATRGSSAAVGSAAASPSADQSETPTVSPTDAPASSAAPSAIASQESSESGDPLYSCEYSASQD